MKFTFNWLKELVDFRGAPEAIAHSLTLAGLEVESVAPLRGPEDGAEDWLFEVAVTPNRGGLSRDRRIGPRSRCPDVWTAEANLNRAQQAARRS